MSKIMQAILSPRVLLSSAIVLVAIALYIITRICADRSMKRRHDTGKAATISRVIVGIVRVLILVFGVIFVLQVNGINVSALLTGLGIASAIVGLALQDYLKDIVMGVYILADHFFSVGECVEYEGRECRIMDMTLKTTKLGDLDDHSVITVCNRNISQIRRFGDRMDINIPLSYKEDTRLVHTTMQGICREIEDLDHVKKCEYKGTQSFESSAILYRIRLFCDPCERADVRRAALTTVQNRLNAVGIAIPFNQLDVHCDIVK